MNSTPSSTEIDVDTHGSHDDHPESNPDDVTAGRRERTPIGALAVIASGAAFYRLVGLPGILAGTVVAVCWYRLSAEATFAFGTILLVVAVPENPPLEQFVLVEGGLLAVLVSTVLQYDAPATLLGAFVAFLAGLLAVTWLGIDQSASIWIGALTLTMTVGLLAYGQHRYALVKTGLVESNQEGSP